MKFTEKDPVLDKAVDILTGKVKLEDAKAASQKAAQERKAKKENKKAVKKATEKEPAATDGKKAN